MPFWSVRPFTSFFGRSQQESICRHMASSPPFVPSSSSGFESVDRRQRAPSEPGGDGEDDAHRVRGGGYL